MLQPPTDNLYKFLAIAGLLLISLTTIFPYRQYQALQLAFLDNRKATALQKLKIQHKEDEIDRLDEVLQITRAAIESRSAAAKSVPERQGILKEIQQLNVKQQSENEMLYDAAYDMKSLIVELESFTEMADFRHNEIKQTAPIMRGGYLVGLIMTVADFWKWYTKLQRYEDALIREEAVKKGLFTEDHVQPKKRKPEA